jgi:hypothetical protein
MRFLIVALLTFFLVPTVQAVEIPLNGTVEIVGPWQPNQLYFGHVFLSANGIIGSLDPDNIPGTVSGFAVTSDGFRASWGKAFDRAKLGDEDLHFHDLRGTAVTRLALAGAPYRKSPP